MVYAPMGDIQMCAGTMVGYMLMMHLVAMVQSASAVYLMADRIQYLPFHPLHHFHLNLEYVWRGNAENHSLTRHMDLACVSKEPALASVLLLDSCLEDQMQKDVEKMVVIAVVDHQQ